MSTTTELLAANERYERLRAAVEELAAKWEWEHEEDYVSVYDCASDVRALVALT